MNTVQAFDMFDWLNTRFVSTGTSFSAGGYCACWE
ncbi:hypothetical protein SAMN05444385_103443 [Tritonibacter mobilis]|nr:hypothetical protein SAMN05444385_103443 [Tritonibacter mobilis]